MPETKNPTENFREAVAWRLPFDELRASGLGSRSW